MRQVGYAVRKKCIGFQGMKRYIFYRCVSGHKTNEAINEYDKDLMIDFNIKLIFKFLEHHIQMS